VREYTEQRYLPAALGRQHIYEVQLYLNELDPKVVRLELFADGINGGAPVRQEMKLVRPLPGTPGGHIYSAAVSTARSPTDYTARVIPLYDGVSIPLEDSRILWER